MCLKERRRIRRTKTRNEIKREWMMRKYRFTRWMHWYVASIRLTINFRTIVELRSINSYTIFQFHFIFVCVSARVRACVHAFVCVLKQTRRRKIEWRLNGTKNEQTRAKGCACVCIASISSLTICITSISVIIGNSSCSCNVFDFW